MDTRARRTLAAAAIISALGLIPGPAGGITVTWDANTGSSGVQGGDGDWDDQGNSNWWDGSGNVQWDNTAGDIAELNDATGGTISLTEAISADKLDFYGDDYTLNGGNSLTLGGSGLQGRPGAGLLTLDVPVTIGANQTWNLQGGSTVDARGDISGAATWTFSGVGTVRLSGDNSGFNGTFNASTPTFVIDPGASSPFGTGTVDFRSWTSTVNNLDTPHTVTAALTHFIGNGGQGAISFTGNALTFTGDMAIPGGNDGDTEYWQLDIGSGTDLTFSGDLSESGNNKAIRKLGAGRLILSGSNSLAGDYELNEGTLGIGHNAALGLGALSLTGNGTLESVGDRWTAANDVELGANTLTIDGSQGINLTGAIGGTGSVVIDDTGDVRFGGNNSYSGTTTVNAGILRVDGTTSGQGSFDVQGPAGLGGNGTIGLAGGNTVTLQDNADLLPADIGVAGTLSVTGGDLVIEDSVTYIWDVTASDADSVVNLTDDITFNGLAMTLDLRPQANIQASDSFVLFTAAGGINGPLPTFSFVVDNVSPGLRVNVDSASVFLDGSSVVLTGLQSQVFPEPSSVAFFLIGGVLLRALRRRVQPGSSGVQPSHNA